jgi:arylsulfatase A-like enzyme
LPPHHLLACIAALALASLAACSEERDARKSGPVPLAAETVPVRWLEAAGEHRERLPAPEGWVRLRFPIAPEDWKPWDWPGVWSTHLELPSAGAPARRRSVHELRIGEREFTERDPSLVLTPEGVRQVDFADGDYMVFGDLLLLVDRSEQLVGQTLEYVAWIEQERDAGGRVHIPGVSGDGFVLLSGDTVEIELGGLERSDKMALQFTTFAYGSPGEGATTTLAVTRNGEPLWEQPQANQLFPRGQVRRIPLGPIGGGTLAFSAWGESGVGVFLAPILVPAEPGSGAPEVRHPDIVVVVVDTLRADSLAPWGGARELAPHLNDFANESLVFLEAHAPTPWTLPSHASLLTGLYPLQHQVVSRSVALHEDVPTLAGALTEAGYRTAAVTDGVLVTAHHGLDHGFGVFLDENQHKEFARSTRERVQAVLDADDGRPLFLLVQTYRGHAPYVDSPATLSAHPELFGADPDPAAWNYAELLVDKDREGAGALPAGGGLAAAEKLRRAYFGGVADFDNDFHDLRGMLGRAGLGDAVLLVTSDHGESLGEHGNWDHANGVFEEETWIPMLLHVPGRAGARFTEPVSLVDVAPTLGALAGLPRQPAWTGRSLLEPAAHEACVFSFECSPRDGEPNEFALYTSSRKVVGAMQGERPIPRTVQAFDLRADRAEAKDLASAAESWPAESIQRWADRLAEVSRPRFSAKPITLTEGDLTTLRALGYTDD